VSWLFLYRLFFFLLIIDCYVYSDILVYAPDIGVMRQVPGMITWTVQVTETVLCSLAASFMFQ